MSLPAVLRPGEIAGVETRNRIIRSSTSETMADDRGIITQQYHDFHTRLARNGVGLIFTGHCSVHPSRARPLIREPDLLRQIEGGRTGMVDCVSCNICLMHEGSVPLKCWRESNVDLLKHAWARIRGEV